MSIPDRVLPLSNYCQCCFIPCLLHSTCLAHVFQSRTFFIEGLSSPWLACVFGALALEFSSTATPYGWEEVRAAGSLPPQKSDVLFAEVNRDTPNLNLLGLR